tara:strand:- start:13777 stop:14334 length:558 start_codon:yes stop_codon:yes gene_type:complete
MPNKESSSDTLPTVLAKAQSELKKAAKSADNPYFKSKYAGLDEVIEACRNTLNSHGIAVTQTVEYTPEVIRKGEKSEDKYTTPQQTVLATTLLYGGEKYQSIKSVIPLEYKAGDMQSFGSALTYARRYGLAAICCLATEDSLDDDGNKAVGEENVAAKVNKRSNYRKAKPVTPEVPATTADEFLK